MKKEDLDRITRGLNAVADAARFATEAFQVWAWSMPGKWPDPFVVLKRADRTGVQELAFGGDLFDETIRAPLHSRSLRK
jgi:hypothetical protein